MKQYFVLQSTIAVLLWSMSMMVACRQDTPAPNIESVILGSGTASFEIDGVRYSIEVRLRKMSISNAPDEKTPYYTISYASGQLPKFHLVFLVEADNRRLVYNFSGDNSLPSSALEQVTLTYSQNGLDSFFARKTPGTEEKLQFSEMSTSVIEGSFSCQLVNELTLNSTKQLHNGYFKINLL